jgi:5-methylcytosine-specific restriction endonuclease McrA
MVRARNPLCCDPLGWHDFYPAPSEQVHHIQNAEDHPHLIFDPSNLAAVCRSCHAEVERMHKAGQPTAHLFEGKAAGGFTSGVA